MLNYHHYYILWSMAEKKYEFHIFGPVSLPDREPYFLYQLNGLGIDETACNKLIKDGYIEINSIQDGPLFHPAKYVRYKVSQKGYDALLSKSFENCKKHYSWFFITEDTE